MALEHENLTDQIIGSAIEVHKTLGPGFLESIYENGLIILLKKKGIFVEQQKEIPVVFEGTEIGLHRLDLLVEKTIIVELKAIKNLEDVHFAVVRSYLKAAKLQHGLLINFNKPTIEVKRVINK
ncbi:GxxExxY protein [candidate division TA06 bacterium]|nr:GxxExxY protein [candidate division TA06 bacterium]